MIATRREIDEDWSEFEGYATNLYARTMISDQSVSPATFVSSAGRLEVSPTTLDTIDAAQLPTTFDVKAITDEIVSLKKVVGELRTYAEEV